MDNDKPLYMISIAAELAGVHPQTLRTYESKGLLQPKRTGGNTRMYSQSDIKRLEYIGQLTEEGINIAGVLRIIDLQERLEEAEQQMDSLLKELRKTKDELHENEMRETILSLAKIEDERRTAPWLRRY
jgi:MerR family transcriptional regulator/heat shock protein HspR